MKLSELKTGEKGVIVKVQGHGGFRKRIIEMGFIKGTEVEVLLNAPLQDPVRLWRKPPSMSPQTTTVTRTTTSIMRP